MMFDTNRRAVSRTAIYLRCFPFDTRKMEFHRETLRRYAVSLGLAEPTVYLDNGCASAAPKPALRQLIRLAAGGAYEVVLVPGPFVFSLYDVDARFAIRAIAVTGCRVVELPDSLRR